MTEPTPLDSAIENVLRGVEADTLDLLKYGHDEIRLRRILTRLDNLRKERDRDWAARQIRTAD